MSLYRMLTASAAIQSGPLRQRLFTENHGLRKVFRHTGEFNTRHLPHFTTIPFLLATSHAKRSFSQLASSLVSFVDRIGQTRRALRRLLYRVRFCRECHGSEFAESGRQALGDCL